MSSNQVMNVYERFALGEYLYAFPEDKTYDEILEMINDYNNEVIVWEVFEDVPPEGLIELIDTLKDGLMVTFVPHKVGDEYEEVK